MQPVGVGDHGEGQVGLIAVEALGREWKTTTSVMPAASTWPCRAAKECMCWLQIGQPGEPAELQVHPPRDDRVDLVELFGIPCLHNAGKHL